MVDKMRQSKAAEVFSPGEYIKEELEARGWTRKDLADYTGLSIRHINDIIDARCALTPGTAHVIGNTFGIDPKLLLSIEQTYRSRNPL